MKRFSFTDVNKTPGEVLDEALKGPIALTKHGKERLVILPAERFHQLVGTPTRRAYSVYDTKAPHYDELREALAATIEDLEGDPKE